MATKKAAPKKAVKSASPVKKETAKSAPKAAVKSAPAKNNKPAPKTAPKKATAPVKAAPKKAAPAPVQAKGAMPASKAAPSKAITPDKKSAAPKAVPAPPAKKAEVKVEPVKKPVVAAPSQQEVKPAIKPLEKPVAKKEAAKPAKPVVIPKTSTTKSVKYEPDFMKSVLDKKRQQESGPTQRYSDSELTEFRDLINRKLDTAKKELAYLQGLITRKDESGDLDEGRYMTMEDGSMSMEREQLSQMASRQIQFIDHLEKAIMRIENKTYGICRVTGKLIDKARLRAVPHATLSMEAKQTMNK
jgi:RNA polymerase-binding transcription factor DksA